MFYRCGFTATRETLAVVEVTAGGHSLGPSAGILRAAASAAPQDTSS